MRTSTEEPCRCRHLEAAGIPIAECTLCGRGLFELWCEIAAALAAQEQHRQGKGVHGNGV